MNKYSYHKIKLSISWMWTSTRITNVSCFLYVNEPDLRHPRSTTWPMRTSRFLCYSLSFFVSVPIFSRELSPYSYLFLLSLYLFRNFTWRCGPFWCTGVSHKSMSSSQAWNHREVMLSRWRHCRIFSRWNFLGWIIFILRWLFVPSVDLMSRSYPICGFIKFGRF